MKFETIFRLLYNDDATYLRKQKIFVVMFEKGNHIERVLKGRHVSICEINVNFLLEVTFRKFTRKYEIIIM